MLVSFKGVSKSYQNFRALKNVDLEIPKGKIIGLLGPNGSGKTTIIKLICGLLKNYTGQILVNDLPLSYLSKENISYLPDEDFLPSKILVKDAVKMYSDFFSNFNLDKCKILLDKFNIDLNKKVSALSKGNNEKLRLVLTLSRDVDLYIFDEPIAGVDPASRDVIFELLLNNFKKGATLLVSTHLVYDIQEILDEVIFVKNGEILLHKDKKELVNEYNKEVDLIFREVFRNA